MYDCTNVVYRASSPKLRRIHMAPEREMEINDNVRPTSRADLRTCMLKEGTDDGEIQVISRHNSRQSETKTIANEL